MSAPSPSDPNTLDLPPSQEEVTRQFPADAATIHPDARPAAPPARVPGYEILEELGRGGMGVVYKARHLKLNRVVALKMILSGGHAGEAERGRFLTEAQSIARLQHPNVVQVFEVGECEGRPFFSMEFCAGGSLEKHLGGTPLPPREAAGLVATLARAMQAAHGHGIVHRDLKPANVLLQQSAVSGQQPATEASSADRCPLTADRSPKVTDFGLAKKLDEQGQTLSGAIMGTPSYVAPEQAEGKKIGPAVDVYALGAILYECLTGRPPFKAATAMETLRQVTSQEAVPPHQLNAGVPRDLETITLKCLQKDPARRYDAADALANDLSRWLAGEPILARPVSPLVRAAKWVRRRPALATLAGVSAAALFALLAVSVAFNVRLRQEESAALRERDEADRQRDEADKQRREADKQREQARQNFQLLLREKGAVMRERDEANKQRREADKQREQARENFRLAREAVDEYARKAAEDPRLKERGVQEVRKEWLLAAERFYQKFVDQAGDDPEVRLEQARAYGRLAAISAEISTVEEAEKQYLQARKLWQKLLADFPDKVECRVELAGVISGLGGLAKERGQMARAEQLLLEAHKATARLADDHPAGHADHYKFQTMLAASHNQLGLYYKDARKPDLAEKQLLRTIELASKLPSGKEKEKELEGSLLVAISSLNLGDLYQNQAKYDKAEAAYDAGRASFEKRRLQGKLSVDHRKVLALMLVTRAILYFKRGDAPRAGKAYHEAASLLEELAKEQPHVLDIQNSLGATLMMMGVHYFELGQTSTAAGYYERAAAIQERLYLNYPQVKQYRTNRLSGLIALSMLYFSTRQAKPCEEKLDRALAAARELVEVHPDDAEMKAKLAEVRVARRQLFLATGQNPRALTEFREELTIREALDRQSDSAEHKVAFAACCCNLGNFVWDKDRNEAHRLYDRAVKLCTVALQKDPAHEGAYEGLTKNLNNRADYLTEKKQLAAALADRFLALEVAKRLVCLQADKASARLQLAYAYRKTAEELQGAGRLDEAEETSREEIALLRQAVADRLDDDKPETCRYQLAEAAARLANFYAFEVKGRARDAVGPYRQAIYHYSRLAVTQKDTKYYLTAAGGEACNLAHLLNNQTGQQLDALPWYGRAEWLLNESLRLKPDDATARRFLRNVYSGRGTALARLGRPAEAAASQAKVVQYQEALVEANQTAESRLILADSLRWLGELHGRAEQPDDAEKAYAKAAGGCEKCLADDKFGGQARAKLAVLCSRRAALHAAKDRTKEAVALLQRERELLEPLVEAEYDHANQLDALGECLTRLAAQYAKTKDYPKAAKAQAEASSHRRQLVSAYPRRASARPALARSYALQGVYEKFNDEPHKALRTLERACEAWDRAIKGQPEAQADAYRDEQDKARLMWALTLTEVGQPERALQLVAASAQRGSLSAESAYQAATISAAASSALLKDAGVPLAVREKQAEAAVRSALALLERARAGGYFDKADRVKDFYKFDDLASFRQRDDFKRWAKKLEARD